MDPSRVNSLLRSLAQTPSRRRALHLLAGFMLGGLLPGRVGLTAAKKQKKKSCPPCKLKRIRLDGKKGKCTDIAADGAPCRGQEGYCEGGTCIPIPPNQCAPPVVDRTPCLPPGYFCSGGRCIPPPVAASTAI